MWKLDKLIFLFGFPILASVLIWFAYVERGHWPALLRTEVMHTMTASQAEASWAWVQVQGRTVILSGEAPDAGALHAARRAILATPGVSGLVANTRIRVWGGLTPPTVKNLATRAMRPELQGTWPYQAAEGLSIELAGHLYVLGETDALRVAGEDWKLLPTNELSEGSYDVEVTAWQAELSASDNSTKELTIDLTPPPAPKVDPYFGRSRTPQLSGRWPIEQAARLGVAVSGRTYELGSDPELKSNEAGGWVLNLSSPLKAGQNDVVATAYDHVGNGQTDLSSNEAVVDLDPPATPTVQRFQSARAFTLRGTWAQGDAVSLVVAVAGQKYVLGQGASLSIDGDGHWKLSPTNLPGEGTYDVVVRTKDRAGNVSQDQTSNELIIKFVPERDKSEAFEETPRPISAFKCQQGFKRILGNKPVRFIARTAKLERTSIHVLDDLAGLAARCPEARIEIAAHTDAEGDFSQNRRLSRLRAFAVAAHFARRGIDRFRLSSVGYGEVRPIASNNTAEGRAKNQRLELYVKR
ncbi:MAG: OmpA family protein [Alphaproteobacteria bacterium]|nr:OmpA family protein [Alphaproteobacteria bacterium]